MSTASCKGGSDPKVWACLVALAGCHGATSAPTRVHVVRREAWEDGVAAVRDVDGGEAYELVQSLTDESGERIAGSPGNARGVAWALRTLPTLGLVHVVAEPVTVQRWERRAESAAIVGSDGQVEHALAVCALGHSVPTPPGGIEAEVVRVASLEAIDELAADALAGKIAFIDRETPRRADGSGYGDAVGGRVQGATAAARKGAVAIVIRSIGTAHDRYPHTGIVRYDDGVARIPAAAISTSDADVLARLLARATHTPVRLRLALDNAELGPTQTANVVGDVVGSGHADEIVLLGAHMDSWDLGSGAIDDGAGIGIVLEAARRIAHAPSRPARTVRVVLFANEESGGDGARAYATLHAAELAHHVLALEADSGDGRVLSLRTATTAVTLHAYEPLARALAPLGIHWTAGEPHGGADLGPMHHAGVPVIDAHQDATRYFDNHHTANDTMAIVARDELDQAASAVTALAWAAANVDGAMPFGRAPVVDASASASQRPRPR